MLLTISVASFALTVAMGNALATAALDGTIDLAETTTALGDVPPGDAAVYDLSGEPCR